MKKVIIALLIILMFLTTVFIVFIMVGPFGNKEKEPTTEEIADKVVALSEEVSLDVVPAAQQAIQEYIKAKEEEEEEERREKEEEEDDDDPMNADPTKDTGEGSTVEAMEKRYIGRWEMQGIIQGDGNLDTSTGAHCTYVFSADHTYTARGKDFSGKKIKESGTWELNANKQIVAGKYTMGIDGSGYLLKDTGERDGKGRKMKYAFTKVS